MRRLSLSNSRRENFGQTTLEHGLFFAHFLSSAPLPALLGPWSLALLPTPHGFLPASLLMTGLWFPGRKRLLCSSLCTNSQIWSNRHFSTPWCDSLLLSFLLAVLCVSSLHLLGFSPLPCGCCCCCCACPSFFCLSPLSLTPSCACTGHYGEQPHFVV